MFFLGYLQAAILLFFILVSRPLALFVSVAGAFLPFAFELPGDAAFLFAVSSLSTGGVAFLFYRRETALLEKKQKQVREMGETFHRKRQEAEAQEGRGRQLEWRVGEIVTLYELTEKMTALLEFAELFPLLQATLGTHLSFETGWLFLIGEKEKTAVLEETFRFSGEAPLSLEQARYLKSVPFASPLLKEMTHAKRPLHLEESALGIGLRKPAVAVPLLAKQELNGVLVLEAYAPEQEESLLILASQFAPALQKVKLYGKIQELAITDGLTHLFSRHYFLERFREEIARSKRYHLALAFLMADIDHFKQVNDHSGHLVGDVVLREVASLIKGSVREIDLVGRYGGEEFSVVLPDTTRESALQVAERIRAAVEAHACAAYDETIRVTLSLGVSVYPEDGEDPITLLDRADTALYEAKKAGRNRVFT